MQLVVALFLAIATTAVLVTSHPVEGDLDTAAQTNDAQSLVRDKRTIGILRDLFPNFSQIIDRKIQMLTRFIFRIVGRLVLQGGAGGGGGGGAAAGDDDRRVQITLPTYPPDELDDEDEDSTGSTTNSQDGETTISPDAENSVGETKKRETRSKREAEGEAKEEEEEEDLEPDATGDNEVTSDNEAEADGDDSASEDSEDPRNKRFLNFNLGGAAGGAGGSGGGSGNFIFDIIRLVAGSGNTQSGDAQNAAIETGKDDAAYGVGVPGPLTRLFVVANKGVAALIQDLILRLAQTSERIVNFKARLITSII